MRVMGERAVLSEVKIRVLGMAVKRRNKSKAGGYVCCVELELEINECFSRDQRDEEREEEVEVKSGKRWKRVSEVG